MARDITTEPSGNILINTGYTVGQLAGGIHYESTATNISGAVGTLDFGGKSVLLHTVTGDLSGSYTFPPTGLPGLTQNATRAVLFIEYTQDATGGRAIPLDTLFANATSRWGNAAVDTAISGKTRVKIIVKRIGGVLTFHVEFLPVHVHGNIAVDTQHSLTGGGDLSQSRTLSLVNDTATPGNHKYYKTDGTGARGWQSLNIQDIDNVTISTPASNQVLTYNGTIWVNAEPPEGGGGVASEVVESLASLTAIAAPTNGMLVNVRGHTAANDGGGGVYMWVSTSTTTANSGTVLEKNGGGDGRWFLRWIDLVNVKVFGVKGDGATDDQTALQLAVDARVPLYIPRGQYLLNAPITWDPTSRPLIMIGEDNSSVGTRIYDNRGGTPEEPLFHRVNRWMIEDGSWTNTVVGDPWVTFGHQQILKNIQFIAQRGRLGHAVCLSGGKNTVIENCSFRASFRGLTMDKTCFDASIKNCYFEGNFRDAHAWDGTTGVETNKVIAKRAWGLYVCSHKWVEGIYVKGYGTGIYAVGTGISMTGLRLEENYYGMRCGEKQFEVAGGPGGVSVWPLDRSIIGAISFEANTIGLYLNDVRSTTISGFGIQGSVGVDTRPTSEIAIHIAANLNSTTMLENVVVAGTFTHGAIVNDTRSGYSNIIATGNVVSYAKTNSPFGQSGSTNKASFGLYNYRIPEGSITAFTNMMMPGLTGVNLRDGLARARNLGDVATPATGATTVAVTFPIWRDKNTYAFNTLTTPTTTSTLAAGTYYYATTVLSKQSESGIVYTDATQHGHRLVTVATGQGVQMTFLGGTVSSLKRRIYRTKVGGDKGNFEGYWQQDSTSATFTDTGQAFTARGMPPINGDLPSCEEDDVNYQIIATPSWATTVHVTSKTTTGFTLNFGTAAPSGGTCSWLLFRP